MPCTFVFGKRDAYGCTTIATSVFLKDLKLTSNAPIRIRRVSGAVYEVDAVKCTTLGDRWFQVDLTGLGIGHGARVTLRKSGKAFNEVLMTAVEKSETMYKKPSCLADAMVDLEMRVDALESLAM